MQSKQLGESVRHRWDQRKNERREVHARIEEKGILGAAGLDAAIRRAAHMSVAEGKSLASKRGEPRKSFESIIGMDDSDGVNFMGRGQIAARSVCRILVDGRPLGTGFLVAPGILLTNNHVIDSREAAARMTAEFDYELDLDDRPRVPVSHFALDPSRTFYTSDADQGLDFTFVAVARKSTEGVSIEQFGWLPMDDRIDKILVGEPAVIIQHPRGEPKRVCLFSAELVDKLDDYLHYTTDTDHGSSGSCVVNRSWQLVALHHASTESDSKKRGRPLTVNEGVRVSSILRKLQSASARDPKVAALLHAIVDPRVVGDGRPRAAEKSKESLRTLEKTSIRTLDADYFSGREAKHFGYKPGFLGSGFSVPLPQIPESLADDVASGTSGDELKYTHYSLKMSISRRLPIFSAVNIDGAQSKRLGRKDRDYEAADVWSYDPRIDAELQLGPEVYDKTDFDYGHMVRREDPVWGDDNIARMANDDSFFMTNCTPQHKDLNERTWASLENAILDAARKNQKKVSVLTGPVLTPHDPVVLDVQVPTAFWKIVAYVEKGKLVAHGFMEFQTRLVADLKIRESLPGVEKAAEYQVPIREIARLTALDFGPLLAADSAKLGRRLVNESLLGEIFGEGTSAPSPGPAPAEPRVVDEATVLREIYSLLSRHFANGSREVSRRSPRIDDDPSDTA